MQHTGAVMSEMQTMLDGKVVVVTGGASGIGRSISIRAAAHGARAIVVGDLVEKPREGGTPTAEAVKAAGADFRFQRTDVSKQADIAALLAAADEVGGIDVMVCNAGIAINGDGPELPEEQYRRLLAVDLDGAYFSARSAALRMRDLRKAGSIILISSMGGLRGSAMTIAYSTVKGGLCLLAAALADSFGPDGIRVNAVCPGIIATALVAQSPDVSAAAEPMRQRTPLRRAGKPEEIGDVVAWLGSEFSSYVTGAAIPVDGGLTAVI